MSAGATDGAILSRNTSPYRFGRSYDTLKWKPVDRVTLDFRLNRKGELEASKNQAPVVVGVLDPEEAGSYQHGAILECAPEPENKWRVVGERRDKAHPNDMLTVTRTLTSLVNYPSMNDALALLGATPTS